LAHFKGNKTWHDSQKSETIYQELFHDGTPFRLTSFYPAEQYDRPLLEMLASLQQNIAAILL